MLTNIRIAGFLNQSYVLNTEEKAVSAQVSGVDNPVSNSSFPMSLEAISPQTAPQFWFDTFYFRGSDMSIITNPFPKTGLPIFRWAVH